MLPIQIWHTHATHTHCSAEGNNELLLTSGELSGSSDTCLICDHQYADYTDEHSFVSTGNKISWIQTISSLLYQLNKAVEANRLYRGPPTA